MAETGKTLRISWSSWGSDDGQLVSKLIFLGLQIGAGVLGSRDLERNPFGDRQLVPLDADQLARVVGEQSHRADAEVAKDLHADAVVALIGLEAETLVRFHRVEPLILQLVGADLVREPDAPPFLVQVQQHASALVGDAAHSDVELWTAIAARRVEDVAGQAPRVHANHHVLAGTD